MSSLQNSSLIPDMYGVLRTLPSAKERGKVRRAGWKCHQVFVTIVIDKTRWLPALWGRFVKGVRNGTVHKVEANRKSFGVTTPRSKTNDVTSAINVHWFTEQLRQPEQAVTRRRRCCFTPRCAQGHGAHWSKSHAHNDELMPHNISNKTNRDGEHLVQNWLPDLLGLERCRLNVWLFIHLSSWKIRD